MLISQLRESGAVLKEEAGIVAEAIGHSLDDFDFDVDALDEIGAEGVTTTVRKDAGQVRSKVAA